MPKAFFANITLVHDLLKVVVETLGNFLNEHLKSIRNIYKQGGGDLEAGLHWFIVTTGKN